MSDGDIEIHHPMEKNETSEENISHSENTIQLNSDESSQEKSIDDELVKMELEETTGMDGEEIIEPGKLTGVGVDEKFSLGSNSDHNPSDDSEDSLVEDQHPTLSDAMEEAMQVGASAASDRKTLLKHQRR